MAQFQQQVFFNQQGPQEISFSQNYIYNTMLLEIASNFEGIIELMTEITSQKKQQVTVLENEWANFLFSNKINILEFQNEDDFVEMYYKKLSLD